MTIAGFLIAGAALPLAFALLYGISATFLLGLIIAVFTIRPLARQPGLAMLIATIGLAIVLEEIIRMASDSRELWMEPVYNTALSLTDGGFDARTIPIRLATLGACAALVAGLLYLLKRTPFGRLWRAVSEDPVMARLLGVDIDCIIARTVLLASLYARTAGALRRCFTEIPHSTAASPSACRRSTSPFWAAWPLPSARFSTLWRWAFSRPRGQRLSMQPTATWQASPP